MSSTPTTSRAELTLHVVDGETIDFVARSLVIAGFAGSDRAAVEHHIAELEAIGVPRPDRTPTFYDVPASLLTAEPRIEVDSRETSGEVEPVLFCTERGWFVGLGSDHTARDLERTDIALSKRACPKVVGRDVVPYEQAVERWTELELRCRTADGTLYQAGLASELLTIPELLDEMSARHVAVHGGLVVFLGTVPLRTGRFLFSDRFELEMALPAGGPTLTCAYDVFIREGRQET